jgi:hypothetical protein
LAIALSLLSWVTPATAASFTASVDRDTLTLGESVTLSLAFNGISPDRVPMPPAVPNLQIEYAGPQTEFRSFNGEVTSSVTHMFRVTPRQAGEFTIPGMSVNVNGQAFSSDPITLKVVKPGAPPPESVASGRELAFFRLSVPKKEIYLGETIVGELQLFINERARNPGNFQWTFPAEGFNAGRLMEGQGRRVQIGNSIYTQIPLSFTLKAVKTGTFELGPITASLVVRVGRADPFERFGGGIFGDFFGEPKQLTIASESIKLQALPLPSTNVPPSFNGAVGKFTLAASVGPTNLNVGDPITVRVQIAGRGALDSLNLPEQTAWKDFKSYPPTSKMETNVAFGLQGTKTFEQVVIPQNADVREVPPISFSYFDPETRGYRTLTQPAVPIVVRPVAATALPVVAAAGRSQPDAPPTQDIVHIKPRLGSLAQVGPPLIERSWFLALQGVPVLAWLSALVWRRRSDALANNPRLRRRRQVAQILREGLNQLRQIAASNNSDEFFATLFRLLQEQLGERLDLPASAITEAVIDEHLRPRGLPEALLAQIQDLFGTCNLARYAPRQSSQELAAVIPKFEAVLGQLQEAKL